MTPDLNQAVGLHRAGRRQEAERIYRAVLARQPRHPGALYLLGLCRLEQGDLKGGIKPLRDVLKLQPGNADAHHALGRALVVSGKPAEAEKHFRKALAGDPGLVDSHIELGNIEAARERPERAEGHYRAALEHQPGHPGILNNLGNALSAQGRDGEAMEAWQTALRADPDNAEALCNVALRLGYLGRVRDAIEQIRAAIANKPKLPELHYNLGIWLFFAKDFEAAATAFEEALRLRPDYVSAAVHLAQTYQYLCDWDNMARLLPMVRAEIDKAVAGKPCAVSPYFALTIDTSEAERLAVAAAEARSVEAKVRRLRADAGFRFDPGPRERLHIGYICSDFRNHPTAHLTRRLYAAHDRADFQVTLFSTGPDDGSRWRRDVEAGADRFEDLVAVDNITAAQRIHELGVDILVDVQGFMGLSRSMILALRPAPIQVSYLCFLGSLGADWLDYMVVDRTMVPPASEAHYREALAFLPDCYQPNDPAPEVAETPSRESQGLPEDGFVFCSFSAGYKIDPTAFAAWMRILARVPGAVLWLPRETERTRANLRAAAEAHGVAPDRLVFATWVEDKAEHMARLALADLFLDTSHYGAHSSAVDSLWRGTPVLTRRGAAFASRGAATLLVNLGLPELIADDLQGYEELAVALAGDPARHAALKAKLAAQRGAGPLFDLERYVRNLEAAYREMWSTYAAGGRPRAIHVGGAG